jgi:hypothetical protein
MGIVVNAVAYQIAWFACVLGGAHEMPWVGTLTAVAVAGWNISRAAQPAAELKLALLVVVLGLTVDATLINTVHIAFTSGTWLSGFGPHWMLALWLCFATTLNVSLRWITARPLVAVPFGAFGGPLAYLAGAKLGALSMPDSAMALPAIGIAWALAMLVMTYAAARFNGATLPTAEHSSMRTGA